MKLVSLNQCRGSRLYLRKDLKQNLQRYEQTDEQEIQPFRAERAFLESVETDQLQSAYSVPGQSLH